MDSVESPQDAVSPPGSPLAPSGSNQDKPPQQPSRKTVRKRTKTGCLTCRRRRIKCDEAKPTCNNCIKSKRDCEGYSQRLTFKEPLGAFSSSQLYGHPVYNRQVQDALMSAQIAAAQTKGASSSSQGPLPVIAPKPPSVDYSNAGQLPFGQGYGGFANPSLAGAPSFNPPQQFTSPAVPGPIPTPFPEHPHPHQHTFEATPMLAHPFAVPAAPQQYQHEPSPTEVSPIYTAHHVPTSAPERLPTLTESSAATLHQRLNPQDGYWQSDDEASMAESDDEAVPEHHLVHMESNDLGVQVAKRLEPHHDVYGVRIRSFAALVEDNILDTYTPTSANSPLNDSQTAAVFWYFVNVTGKSMSLYERHPFDPTPFFEGHAVPKQRQHIWTYTFPIMSFNHPALLQAMLALGSLQMAKLQGAPPTAAMKHYHLSLRRIAKNYQSPHRRTQPATLAATLLLGFYEVWNSDHDKWCKHMWGARAVIRDIPFRKLTREALAYRRRERERERERERGGRHRCGEGCLGAQHGHGHAHGEHDFLGSHGQGHDAGPADGVVDTELIFLLSGQVVDYGIDGPGGRVLGDGERGGSSSSSSSSSRTTERDVETYEHLRDLYWWYCKMDVYQSFLGGTRPFMEYHQWTQCVPRGPFGKIDSIYGTFDFLILLLGRLANFSSRDLARKRRARKAQGTQGPPGQQVPGQPPRAGHGPGGQQQPPPQQQGPGMGRGQSPPSFPGLMPTSGRVTVPRGFTPPRETSPTSSDTPEDTMDFDASTAKALREWEEIRQAFDVFAARLGPDFAPMGPDFAPPEMTPFGPALMYRTYSIAGIWMNYYMGLIVLHRAHPSMPPVAVIAAGMAAQQTGRWANEVARIAAGLHEDTTHVATISTLVGAAFIESCFPLFVAGVQFRDLPQRHWTIRRLRDIARLTGWQSARQIADGCESGWNKAAELGRGPPYHSPPELGPLFPPDSVWDRPRRLDRRIREERQLLMVDGGGENGTGGGTGGRGGRGEQRLVLAKSEQAHYALGLLSVEQDLDTLEIVDDDGEGEGEGEGRGG